MKPPQKNLGGRPHKLTPETRARLIELVAAGVPYKHACAAARISFQSFCNWREQLHDFREELEAATAKAIEKYLSKIQAASEAGDWRASCWMLEHRFPESFARNRIEVTGANGAALAVGVAIYLPKKDGELPTVTVDTAKEIENGD